MLISTAFAQCTFSSQQLGALTVYGFTANTNYTSPPNSFLWDFGDGQTSTQLNPTHVYNSMGNFNVCFSVLDSNGIVVCNWCDSVNTSGPAGPFCNFTYTPDSVVNSMFHFTGSTTSTGGTTLSWDFGDGLTGTGQSPSHTYTSNGTYNVCMIETDSTGNVICTFCSPVTVGTPFGNCNFTSQPDTSGTNFTFTANVTSGWVVTWDFGDNTSGTGNPVSHSYNSNGTFLVCMTATDNLGNMCTWCDTIVTGNGTAPCNFTYSTSPGTSSVNFTAQTSSGGNITWDFGDGTTGSGIQATHVYAANGTYTVCMTETNFFGTILCTYCMTITIGNNPNNCYSNFLAVSLGLTAFYIDLSTVNPQTATYSWDFGDGGSSSLRFPQHVYALPGTYNVCLSVFDGGCTDTYCSPVTVDTVVNNPVFCMAHFVTLQLAPFQLAVVNLSSGINLSFMWDFGDGSTSTLAYPSHTYATTGSYNLCLTVTDGNGCTSTYCDSLQVDSTGNVYKGTGAFTINVISPSTLTGVPENAKDRVIGIYPNPVSTELHITFEKELSQAAHYRLISLSGSEVSRGTLTRKDNAINASGWNTGAYILEVTYGDGYKTYGKIIRQ